MNPNAYAPPRADIDGAARNSASSPTPDANQPLEYAGFWRRFFSFWADAAVMLPLTGIIYLLSAQSRLFYVYWLLPGLLVGLWFHVDLVRRYGGTPGKLLLKTRIAMVDGSRVTAKAAALRYAVMLVLAAASSVAFAMSCLSVSDTQYFSLDYMARNEMLVAAAPPWYRVVAILMQVWIWGEFLTMLFNKRRRAVHDFIAGTVVVRSTTAHGGNDG